MTLSTKSTMTKLMRMTKKRKKVRRKSMALKTTVQKNPKFNQLTTQLVFNLRIVSLLDKNKLDIPLETTILMLRLVPL